MPNRLRRQTLLAPSRKLSQRQRKIWLSVAYTLVGTALLTALAMWAADKRDTDLVDPTLGVTAGFKEADQTDAPEIRFVDVARQAGVDLHHGLGPRSRILTEDTGSGLAWGDYDGDGDWDLYAVNFIGVRSVADSSLGANRLFRNDKGHFTDITAATGVGDPTGFGMGATFVDYNADGHLDLYVTNYGANRLFRNRGDGRYDEVAAQAGVADSLWSTGVAWGDFNRDGELDLYVCNYLEYDATDLATDFTDHNGDRDAIPFSLNPNAFDPQPNHLYQNLGDGTFTEVAEASYVSNTAGRSLAATGCDLNGDGWLDLYVNNDVSTNKLYMNMGSYFAADGLFHFADLAAITGTADPRGSMGLSVGEIGAMDGTSDGLPDLFITHWIAQENALYKSVSNAEGELEYRDKTRQFRLGEISIDMVGWGCALADFDLDGRPDIAVANGSTMEDKENPRYLKAEPILLFWNDGEKFHNLAAKAGDALAQDYWARGLAVADFDLDGDVDIAISVNRGQPLLLRNETASGHRSLKINLRGSPAQCFGAKVSVRVGDNLQTQWYGADVSFLGMHAAELVFGLGKEAQADTVKVQWADGNVVTFAELAAGTVDIAYSDGSK